MGVLSTRFHIIAAHSGATVSDTSDSAATQPVIIEEAKRAAFVKKQDEASALALQQLRRYTFVARTAVLLYQSGLLHTY